MPRRSESLRAACEAIRPVDASRENAARLQRLYASVQVSDADVAACAQDTVRPVDGMTEPATVDDLLALLQTAGTLALEVPDPANPGGTPHAFVINHYAVDAPDECRRFRQFMLESVFDQRRLEFASSRDADALDAAFSAGRILYFGECVSVASQTLTTALIAETYTRLVRGIMACDHATVLGKCLVGVRLTEAVNTAGNVRIRRLAESIGMTQIAVQTQARRLRLGVGGEERTAELLFGLFLGDTRRLHQRLELLGLEQRGGQAR